MVNKNVGNNAGKGEQRQSTFEEMFEEAGTGRP